MTKYKSVFNRFVKGLFSGAVTSMGLVTVAQPSTWKELSDVLSLLAVAGIAGAINGGLLALQKWYSWKE